MLLNGRVGFIMKNFYVVYIPSGKLRPILNFALGANFTPRGENVPWEGSYPLGVKFSVRPSILLNSRECSPLGVNEGASISPRGQVHP
jgi:hypothetical protein